MSLTQTMPSVAEVRTVPRTISAPKAEYNVSIGAHQLDPLSPIIKVDVGWVYIRARQYDDHFRVQDNEDPTYAETHHGLAQAYWAKHMYPQVTAEMESVRPSFGRPKGI